MPRVSRVQLGCFVVAAAMLSLPALAQDSDEETLASEFGEALRYEVAGGITASGEPYNPDRLTVAHASLPFGTLVEITFRRRTVTARVNDRDTAGGIVRLSARAADQLGLPPNGGIVEVTLDRDEAAFLAEQVARRNAAASATTPRSATTEQVPASGRYTVQLASFADEGRAVAYAGRMRGAWIHRVTVSGGSVFRVNYGIYPNRESATRALEVVTADGRDGFVQQIANAGSSSDDGDRSGAARGSSTPLSSSPARPEGDRSDAAGSTSLDARDEPAAGIGSEEDRTVGSREPREPSSEGAGEPAVRSAPVPESDAPRRTRAW